MSTCLLFSCRNSEPANVGASGRSLLQAVMNGEDKRAAMLVTEGVSTEVRNDRGDTPLLHAVRVGNLPITRVLLRNHADADARTSHGKGPLELALDSGNEKMLRLLVEEGVSPDEVGYDGNPLVHKAIRLHDLSTVKLLLRCGINPDRAGKDGLTPLHLAVQNSYQECIDLLLESGADVNQRDDKGNPPLAFALGDLKTAASKTQSIIKCLAEAGADMTSPFAGNTPPLLITVRRGDNSLTLLLINHGALVNEPDAKGVTPLHVAWENQDWSLFRLLLSRGAQSDFVLGAAIESQNLTALRLFSEHGEDIASYIRETSSRSDNMIAACVRDGKLDLLMFFLNLGLDPNLPGREQERPLHMAIAKQDATLVDALLNHGANPNLQFHRPASKEMLEMVQKKSMRWFLEKDRRITPLMMAANNGDISIISSLLNAGAKKYTYSGRYRLYPLNFASRRGDVKAMQVILGQNPENEKHHAVLDLSDQRVRLYNATGQVVFSSRVSTGKRGYRTPTGTYVITDKHRHHTSSIYGSSMPYFQRLSCAAFGFHYGVCPGYPASHGCIRMPYSSAKKLFSLTPVGTRVVIQP